MNKKVSSHWYLFLLGIAVSITATCIAITMKTAPKEEERIQVFVGAKNCQVEPLRTKLFEAKDPSILEVSINLDIEGSSTFSYVYNTVFSEMSMFVLPSSFLSNGLTKNTEKFATLLPEYLSNYTSKPLEYLEVGGHKKGVLLHKKSEKEGIASSYITYTEEEEYYLFLNSSSPTIGDLGKTSKSDAAMKTMATLLGL
ncbi:MAG: hypothetical protein MJ239_04505 [Bacilli bacterium]|nr:hypothetical protein [Bacilli bacterium]